MPHTIEASSPALVLGVSYSLRALTEPAVQEEEQPGSACLGFMVVIASYLILGMGIAAAWALWRLH